MVISVKRSSDLHSKSCLQQRLFRQELLKLTAKYLRMTVMNGKTEDIFKKVKKYIAKHQMISDGDVILIGVSGGADSVCLLYLLWELSREMNFRLLVVHVNHGVREDAEKDAVYVEKLCEDLNVPFFLKKVDMEGYAKAMGLSPEEAGRSLRYQAFAEVLEGENSSKIAVAHNNNDRAETMLFHLFRGSGLKGLGSIRPVREQVIRPLLCLDRAEIETYLEERKIAYCIDSTNDEDTYTRNKIRHYILPYAEEQICKNVTAHVGDAADILAETEDFVQKLTALAYERCRIYQEEEAIFKNMAFQEKEEVQQERDSIALDLNIFRAEDKFLQKMILLRCMEQLTPHRKDITREHIEALLKIIDKGGSKELSLPYCLTVRKEYDTLVICKKSEKSEYDMREAKRDSLPLSVSIPGEAVVPGLGVLEFKYLQKEDFFYKKGQIIPEKTYTKWFDYDKITTTLLLRTRKTGDYLTIDNNLQRKTVKEYMINEKIPKMQRDCIYLLADGPHILWIPGYRISQYYKVSESTECILQVRLIGGR